MEKAIGEKSQLEQLQAMQDAGDFLGTFSFIKSHQKLIDTKLKASGVRGILMKATRDRTQQSFIDAVRFGERPLAESIGRLERLLSFTPGSRVLSKAFGLGTIRAVDGFYRRITVDFRMRHGHQFTFDAACETLRIAPENHILVINAADPERIATLIREKPAEFIKAMLSSYGDMPVTRIEELAAANGFVKQANWKEFWERARTDLKKDMLVEVPVRRADPLHLKATVETYGKDWFETFGKMTDPKSILSSVKDLLSNRSGKESAFTDDERQKLAERLEFALKGARGVDEALYCRIAFALDGLKLNAELVAKARRRLWEGNRFLFAARSLPARETENLAVFLTAENRESTKKDLFATIPDMCFPFLTSTLDYFSGDADCGDVVAELLKGAHPPATLVVAILGRYDDFKGWKQLPSLSVILAHAIALGEGKQTGETLRMQNFVRRLFADQSWLEKIFKALPQPEDRALLFERFQASATWDPSTHRLITVRMSRLDPALAEHIVAREAAPVQERITSLRSHRARQAAYDHLIKVEIPENTAKIKFAKSYGDLSENAEYQYAKDEERALQKKQNDLQKDLNDVKPVAFDDVATDLVRPGVQVTLVTAEGAEKTYAILGEWDNDETLGILSNKTRLAGNMLGKKIGDAVETPDAEGRVTMSSIKDIAPLSENVRAWING